MKKFFKTIVRIEVLSEGTPWEGDIEALVYDITDGDCSGAFLDPEIKELTAEEMQK